ncbi:DUF3256 family protein [Parabacteroides sp. OttesenSCG-928-G21]|nr:DUF3256 family protein [Parabacteroides sp. OttesenSCG-928-G21]
MKRILLLFISLFIYFGQTVSAQDIATIFSDMPDQYLPQLDVAWRKDLVDLYKFGKEAKLQNLMAGYSTLVRLEPDYLLLQQSEKSTLEMKMLPLINNTYLLCVVTTVDGPVSDSRIEFFTTDWEPLDKAELLTPVTQEWFLKDTRNKNSDAYLDAISRLDMELIKYQLSPDNQTLTATYTTPLYLSREDQEKIQPFLKEEPKVYKWNKNGFK